LAAITLDMGREPARAGDAVRVTTSFDVKYASAVLRQVSKVFSAGFGQAEASRVYQDINVLKPDEPKVWQFSVQYKGNPEPFEIRALMDDLGMIDLDFAAGADSAPAVRAAVDGYLNGRGG
jgi:regulatory protein YycI of two-component signal transduction system YycFG